LRQVDAPGAPEELQRELDAIERRLAGTSPRNQSVLLKHAGDLCASMGERRRALGWYGRAVNLHLELGEASRAAALCHTILSIQPEAVRARCTLAWLAMSGGRTMEARQLVGEYAAAARAAGQDAMAAQQLTWMFEAADDGFLRHDIARALRALNDDARSTSLPSESRPTGPLDHDELWARVLRGTLAPPPAAGTGGAGGEIAGSTGG
jgi:hypothetical protein